MHYPSALPRTIIGFDQPFQIFTRIKVADKQQEMLRQIIFSPQRGQLIGIVHPVQAIRTRAGHDMDLIRRNAPNPHHFLLSKLRNCQKEIGPSTHKPVLQPPPEDPRQLICLFHPINRKISHERHRDAILWQQQRHFGIRCDQNGVFAIAAQPKGLEEHPLSALPICIRNPNAFRFGSRRKIRRILGQDNAARPFCEFGKWSK